MFLSRISAQDRSPFGNFFFEPVGMRTGSGARVTPDSAMALSAVFRAVSLVSGHMALLPLKFYKRDSLDQVDHPLLRLLNRRPNKWQNAFEWREMLQGHLELRGNAYNEIYSDARGQITDLIPRHPDRVQIEMLPDGDYRYRITDPDGTQRTVSRDSIWHLRGLSSNGIVGLSVIEYARESFGLGLSAQSYGARFFANDAKPAGGWVEFPGNYKDKSQRDQVRESIQDAQSGSNRGKIMLLDHGMKYHEVGVTNDDAQFLQTRQFQVADIARWFGVPPHKIGDLSKSAFCLPAGTLIFSKNGPVPIENINVGDEVWSRDKDEWVLQKVEASACTGIDEILEIKTGIRTIRANARHVIPVRRKVYVPFSGGRGICTLIDGERFRASYEIVWVPAGEIKKDDYLLTLNGLPDTGMTSCPTREECTEEFMEVLGMLIGDGYFAFGRNGKKSTFGISHGENDSYLSHYVEAVEKEFVAGDGPYAMKNGGTVALKSKQRDKNTTVFYSTPACAELEANGITGGAKTKRVPPWVFEASNKLKLAFLRGYLDADGTVSKIGYIRYVSVNKDLLEDVRHLCMSVGVRVGNLFYSDLDSDFGTGKKYQHRLFAFECTNVSDNMRIGSHTDFYHERWNNRIASKKIRVTKTYPFESRERDHINGITFESIRSITKSKIVIPVYNLSVENTHNYIADGVLVRNSNIEQQALEYITDALLTRASRWEASIEADLLFDHEEIDVEYDFDELMRGDQAARAAYYHAGTLDGWLTRNEARSKERLKPIDGLDEPLRPLNMVEESQAEDDEADLEAAEPPAQEKTEPVEGESARRLYAVLGSSAGRIARRITKSGTADASLIAETLAVSVDSAQAWVASIEQGMTTEALTASLIQLGKKE